MWLKAPYSKPGSMLDGLTWAYFWNKPAKPVKYFSDFPDEGGKRAIFGLIVVINYTQYKDPNCTV